MRLTDLQYFLENNVVEIGTLEDIVSRENVKSKLESAGYTDGKTALSIGQAAFIDGEKFVDLILENIDVFSDEELISLGLYKELMIL